MVCLSNCMHVICLYCGLLEHARKVDIGGVEEQSASVFSVEVRWHLSNSAHFCPEFGWPKLLRNVCTYLPTYLPTRMYDITTQKMRLSLHLLSSYCVMYRLLLNRRERLSSTLTCACSCCASLALSIVVHTVHATRLNSQACLFQWPSFATILIAVPHLMIAVQVIQGITTEHSWYTRCLNVKLLWNNCPSRSVDCIIFNCPSFRHCRLCFVRVSSSWYEVKLCWRKRSRRKRT